MSIDQDAGNWVRDFKDQSAALSLLPKNVRFLGETPRQSDRLLQSLDGLLDGLYEFEVVTGNAAYKEGERFYLTAAQAKRAYFAMLCA